MDPCTDRLGLNNLELFRVLRKSLSTIRNVDRNIMECKDDILFVWDTEEECLLTFNLKCLGSEAASHQKLVPVTTLSFGVDRLVCSGSGHQIALFGRRGLAVLDVPKRWNRFGLFQGGKTSIACRSRIVDERYLSCSTTLDVVQVRWHPGSPSDSHLVVLTSDNSLRLYDTAADTVRLLLVWSLGRAPSGKLTSSARVPLLGGLGDTAVDFDFAPPFVSEDKDKDENLDLESLQWPIMILRGNGDVCCLAVPLSTKPTGVKPVARALPMYPPDDDNYGGEACSIMVLPSSPPILVVATCSGTLYHCLLLAPDDDKTSSINDTRTGMNHNQYLLPTLHVLESVELELGLSLDQEYAGGVNCPLHLHPHPMATDMYLVSHEAGVHILYLPMVKQLDKFLDAPDEESELCLPAFNGEASSTAEYLICTKVCSADGEADENSEPSPLLGVTLSSSPPTLIALLSGGEVVSVALASTHLPSMPTLSLPNNDDNSTKTKEPFDEHIKKLLKHNNVQPILKLNKNATPSLQETVELVTRATQLYRKEYFQRHKQVRSEIEHRIAILQNLKKHQFEQLKRLESERSNMQSAAEKLAEKYEEIKDRQELLTERAEQVLRMANMKQPIVSSAEIRMGNELKTVQENVSKLKKKLESVRKQWNYQRMQMSQWKAHEDRKKIEISEMQINTIYKNLKQAKEEIADIVKTVHEQQDLMNLN